MNRRILPWLLKFSVTIALLPFIVLCYYTQPFHDDYANGVHVQKLGIWGAQAHLFTQWTGRFFTSFLLTAGNPLGYEWLSGVAWVVLFVFGLRLFVVALLLRTLTKDQLRWSSAGWIAAAILVLYAAIVPSTYSALYYFTDVAVYQVPALLLIIVPVAASRAQHTHALTHRYLWLGLACVATVAAAGSNELTIVLLGWLLVIASSLSIYRRQWSALRCWLLLGVVLLVAGAVAVTAPGNYARMQVDSDPFPGVLSVVARTANALEDFLFIPNNFLLLSIPVVLAPWIIRFLPARPAGLRLPLPAGAAIVLGGLSLGTMLYQSIWNDPIPLRACNVLLWWWMIGWLVACWAALPTQVTPAQLPNPKIQLVIMVVLALVVGRVSLRAWRELLTAAPLYARQWEARYQLFRAASQQPGTHIIVEPLHGIDSRNILLQGSDFKLDSNHPYNAQPAKWFGLAEISRSDAQP